MEIIDFIKIFLLLIIIDFIWLKFVMGNRFNKMIYSIQNAEVKIRIIPALFVYVFMTLLLYYVGIKQQMSVLKLFGLGFLTYGIYDMTNYATIQNYKLDIALIDMTWGGILFGIVGYIFEKI
jgi:uncharacterized membrane protein